MKAPFRPETNFSHLICATTNFRLLLNNFYFTHKASNNQGVLQAQSTSYTFTSACLARPSNWKGLSCTLIRRHFSKQGAPKGPK